MTYGNTQTKVTERQTEDTGIVHKTNTYKSGAKEEELMPERKWPALKKSCSKSVQISRDLRFDRGLLLLGRFVLILILQFSKVVVVILVIAVV